MTAAQRKTPTVANGGSDAGGSYTDAVDNEVEKLWEVVPHWLTNVTGTNTITATCDTSQVIEIASYKRPRSYWFIPAATNTSSTVTLNIGTRGARPVKDKDGNNPAIGTIVGGRLYLLVDDGTNLRIASTNDQAVAPRGLQWIASFTASGAAAINVTSGLDSTYKEYLVLLENLQPATNAVQVILEVSQDGGATWLAATYVCVTTEADSGGGGNPNTSTAAISLCRAGTANVSNSANYGLCGRINIFDPSNTTRRKQFLAETQYQSSAGTGVTNFIMVKSGGYYDGNNSAVNAFRIRPSAGNISGTLHLFGIRTS